MINDLISPNLSHKIPKRQNHFYFDEGIYTSFCYHLEDLCYFFNLSIVQINNRNKHLKEEIDKYLYPSNIESFEDLMLFRKNESIAMASDQINSVKNYLYQSTAVFLWIISEQTENKLISLIEKKINGCETEGFTDWKRRKQYFKSLNVNIENFKSYFDILEVQKYNNKVKHLGKVDKELLSFRTFRNNFNYPLELVKIPLENYLNNIYLYMIDLFCEIESKIFDNKLREQYI